MQPSIDQILALLALVSLPVVFTWLITVLPPRRREAEGLHVGNPLKHSLPFDPAPVIDRPLIALSRQLSSEDLTRYIHGLRFVPVERAAPLLSRCQRSDDPALQLYAQSVLARGIERLQSRFHRLKHEPAADARSAAWLLETGLTLAHPSISSIADRFSLLGELAQLAREKLELCEHTPALLAAAVQVFLASGQPQLARAAWMELPAHSPLRVSLQAAVGHACRQTVAD